MPGTQDQKVRLTTLAFLACGCVDALALEVPTAASAIESAPVAKAPLMRADFPLLFNRPTCDATFPPLKRAAGIFRSDTAYV